MQSIKLINGKEHQQEAEGCLVDTGVGAAHIISIVYDVQSIPNPWKTMNEPIKLRALTTWNNLSRAWCLDEHYMYSSIYTNRTKFIITNNPEKIIKAKK